LNDARAAGSAPFSFYTEHVFQWTRKMQRRAGRCTTLLRSNIPIYSNPFFGGPVKTAAYDDYLLPFYDKTEYMVWDEQEFGASGSLVHQFWHTHHEYTADMWVFSASAKQLGLLEPRFNPRQWVNGLKPLGDFEPIDAWKQIIQMQLDPAATNMGPGVGFDFVNLTNLSMSIQTAMDHVLAKARTAAQECRLSGACQKGNTEPRLRCKINQDRWDVLEDGTWQERFHAPHCDRWDFKRGDKFTLVSFHKDMKPHVKNVIKWMHTVWYAWAVEKDPDDFVGNGWVNLFGQCPPGSKEPCAMLL